MFYRGAGTGVLETGTEPVPLQKDLRSSLKKTAESAGVGTLRKDGVLQDTLGTLGFADWPLSPCLPASLPATRMLPVIIKGEVSSEF